MTQSRQLARYPVGWLSPSRLGLWLVPLLGLLDTVVALAWSLFVPMLAMVELALALLALSAWLLDGSQRRIALVLAWLGGALALASLQLTHWSVLPLLASAVVLLAVAATGFCLACSSWIRALLRGLATTALLIGLDALLRAMPGLDMSPTLVSAPAAAALCWTGWTFATLERKRAWSISLMASAALSGFGWLGLLGWLLRLAPTSPALVGQVSVPFHAALAFILMGHALWLLAIGQTRHAWYLGLACIPLALPPLLSAYLGMPHYGFWHPLELADGSLLRWQLSVPTSILLLVVLLGLAAAMLGRRYPGWWSALLASGMLVACAGVLLLLGHLAGMSAGAVAGGGTPISMPVTMGLFVLGTDLAGGNPRSPWEHRYRTLAFPAAMGLLTILLSLMLWRALDAQQQRLEQAAAQSRQQGVMLALRDGTITEVQAVRRVATRLAATPEARRQALFDVDARQYLADIESLDGLAYVDSHRHVLTSRFQHASPIKVGALADVDAERKLVYDQADASAKPQLSVPLKLVTGSQGQLIVVPIDGEGGRQGYVVGAIRFDSLFSYFLAPLPADEALRVKQGGQLIYARGTMAPGSVSVVDTIPIYGQQWQVELYYGLSQRHSRTAQLVLLLGLVLGGLLTVALRLWAMAQERARVAEATSDQLRAQVSAREAMQVALADSERNMVTVMESITDGVFVVDREWRYTYVNPQAAQMLGADPANLIGRSSLSTFSASAGGEGSPGHVQELWSRACRDDQPATLELTLGAAQRWFEMRVYPHAQGLTVYLHEISVRKRYEQELHKREAEHRYAQTLAHLGNWELQLRSGKLHWSPEACTIFGVEQVTSGNAVDMLRQRVHPEDWPRLAEAQQRLYRDAAGIDMIYRIVRPDGEVRVLHGMGALLQGDDDPIVVGCVQDITEQKQAEEALRETSAELGRALEATRLVMDRAPDLIVVADRDIRFLRVSAASHRLWGYAPDDLVGQPIMGLVHPDDVEATVVAVAEVMGGKPTSNFRHRNISRDGRILYMQWSAIWSEQSQCMYAVGRDHTDLHRAEDMDERQRQMLTAIARRRPLPELLESMVDAYEAHHPDALCSVLLLRDGCLYRGAAPRLPAPFTEAINGVVVGPAVGSCGTAAWRAERVIVTDIANDPLWQGYADLALPHDLRACWSTPILARDGEVLGTFAVYYKVARAPQESELEGLDTLAVLAGVAIEHEQAFQRLSESEQRFRSLFEHHPDGVFALDMDGCLIRGNPTGLALLGLQTALSAAAPAPLLAQRFAAVDQAPIQAALERAAGGEPGRLDAAALDVEGHSFPAHLVSIPILVQGQPQGVFVVLQDQRELRHAQQGMATQLALISAIADCVGEGLLAVDSHGQPTFINHIASHLLELAPGHVPGAGELPSALVMALHAILDGADSGSDDDASLVLREGHARDVSYLATPLLIGGQLAGAVIAFRDIAADKAARQALQQRNYFFEMSREVFCIADPASGRFVQLNPAYARLLGYSEEEMLAIPFMDLLHPQDHPPTSEAIDQQMESVQQIAGLITRMRCADGSYRWLEWNSITGPDGLLYGAARDTTQRRQADEALARAMEDLRIRNRELQDFAYVASHDLQEPLRKIQTFSDRLRTKLATQVDESSLDYLERMARAALRLQTLIDDLLTYSRAGTSADNMTSVNLSSVLAMVQEDLEIRIREADASFDIGTLPTIRANAAQMRQLLQNLLANALKFRATERPCRIAIHARDVSPRSAAAGTLWELRVEDNGIGFDPTYAERIFSPFQRLHPRNVYAGTGIGLAIVRRIAERHGGTVRAEGYTGQGATFVITLSSQPRAATVQEHGRDIFIDS